VKSIRHKTIFTGFCPVHGLQLRSKKITQFFRRAKCQQPLLKAKYFVCWQPRFKSELQKFVAWLMRLFFIRCGRRVLGTHYFPRISF